MEKRKKWCESTKAEEQLGQRLTISNPNDGGRLFAALEFSLKKEQLPNGDIVAYFEDGAPNIKVTYRDAFDNISELMESNEYWMQRKRFYTKLLKEAKVECGIRLVDFVEGFAETFEWLETSSDVEEGRYAKYLSESVDEDDRHKTMFANHREFNTHEFRVNGFC